MIEQLLGDDVESSGRYLAEVIYGATDGILTTFPVLIGISILGAVPLAVVGPLLWQDRNR
jgi:hypothetical protein